MLTITQNQALQRWDTLPDILKEALYSEANSDFLWKTCEKENVPDEKTYGIARISGYVLLGFIHPGDMADELKEGLSLDPKTCAAVASALDVRIFTPLRPDLDKIYQPVSSLEGKPKIIQDIGRVPLAGTSVATSTIRMSPPPSAQKPGLSGSGWSRLTPETPVVKLSQTPAAALSPTVKPIMPAGSPKFPASPAGNVVDEFERRSIPPVPTAPRTPAAATSGPAPVIIHQDDTFKTQQTTPNFRLPLPAEKIDMQSASKAPPVRPAVLELGNAPAPTKTTGSVSTPRMVHYTEYKSPSPEAPVAPQGPRQITDMTAPPTPAMPPKPPTPPAPAQNKVVYKNYSETPPVKQ